MIPCKPHTPRAQTGETLAEVLVAMLVVALSTLLLAAMATAAGSIDHAAFAHDAEFYASVTAVEQMDSSKALNDPAGTITYRAVITPDPTPAPPAPPAADRVDVDVYQDGDLTLYRREVGP